MELIVFIKILISLSWPLSVYYSFLFVKKTLIAENKKTIMLLAATALFMLACNFIPAIRSGYDNNHDFQIISSVFFPNATIFKEISPIFIKRAVDIISNSSLYALVLVNRVLPVFSLMLFFAVLRRCGTGITASFAGTAFMFLNFHVFVNSSSFGTASVIVFSLMAAFSAYVSCCKKEKINVSDLIWIFASSIIVITARVEHTPVLFLLGLITATIQISKNGKTLKKPVFLTAILAGTLLITVCFTHQLFSYQKMTSNLCKPERPADTFQMQFIKENFSIMLSKSNEFPFPEKRSRATKTDFIILYLALLPILPEIRKLRFYYIASYSIFIFYNIFFVWQDTFPMQFARHRIVMMIPFAAMIAFALQEISDLMPKSSAGRLIKRQGKMAIASLCFFYGIVNAITAKSLNIYLMNNDREWEFLLKTQPKIQFTYKAESSLFKQNRRGIIKLYFESSKNRNAQSIYYISHDDIALEEENSYADRLFEKTKKLKPLEEYFYDERLLNAEKSLANNTYAPIREALKEKRPAKAGFYYLP